VSTYRLLEAPWHRPATWLPRRIVQRVRDKVSLAMAYYQQNRFDEIKKIRFPPFVRLPSFQLVEAFDRTPYQLSWSNAERVARLPFVAADPLPLLRMEFDGEPVTVIFDTGADVFMLDPEIGKRLGTKTISRVTGTFGGGKRAPIGLARIESVRLGEVRLDQVPIMTLPTKRFSVVFPGHTIGGVIGTGALRLWRRSITSMRSWSCGNAARRAARSSSRSSGAGT
jgi:hypothetical protein